MADYIDRDMLIAEGWHMQRTIRSMTATAIEIKKPTDFPAADAVEVVRCKDCKHREKSDYSNRYYCAYTDRDEIVTANDYCSRGERKEGKG